MILKGKRHICKGLVALLSITMFLSGTVQYVSAASGDDQTAAVYTSEAQEVIASEEHADGETVASAIQEIIGATGQMDLADEAGVERLQSYIADTQQAFEELPTEEQAALGESIALLEHAAVSVNSMQDAMAQVAETGSFEIEQTGRPNSWRYMDGVRIEEALDTVAEEQKDVARLADEEDKNEPEMQQQEEEQQLQGAPSTEEEEPIEEEKEETLPLPEEEVVNLQAMTEVNVDEISEMATIQLPAGALSGADSCLTAVNGTLKGIDISLWNWNKPIEWAKVKKAVDFIIIRCGYGSDYTSQDDKRWAESVAACEKYGIPYGVYLYSYATTDAQVDSEVAHTLRLLKGTNPTFPVYWDTEENAQRNLGAARLSAMATRYCSKIRAAGYKAGVYASASWWTDYLSAFASDASYSHWVAHWAAKCGYTGRYEMWQYSDMGTVDGMTGYVDMNYWYGDSLAGWKREGNTWYYLNSYGAPIKNQWLKDKGNWFWLDADGKMVENTWLQIAGVWYHFRVGGYMDENKWIKDDTGWRYVGSDGAVWKNQWIQDGDAWCYVKDNGYRATNQWILDATGWRWLSAEGKVLADQWITDKGQDYYLKSNGYMAASQWVRDEKGWRWLGSSGSAVKEKWIKGVREWYYVKNDTYMADAEMIRDGSATYYLKPGGAMAEKRWVKSEDQWYYARSGGSLAKGQWLKLGGVWYFFDTEAVMLEKQWKKLGGVWYYFKNSGAIAESQWLKLGNTWYYFKNGGAMAENEWIKLGNTWYYFKADGSLATGTQTINGKTYSFNASGAWVA